MATGIRYHVALFEYAVIALDVRKGNYLLYDGKVAAELGAILDAKVNERSILLPAPLLEDGILINDGNLVNGAIYDHRALRFQNFSSEIWSDRILNGRDASRPSLRLLTQLMWNALLLKVFGFRALKKLARIHLEGGVNQNEAEIRARKIPERFLKASLWSPLHVACLQMSFAIAEEFRRNGIEAQLVIGVRPLPFVAHAWVEIDGNVYGDEAKLPILYGEIYRTPEVRQ